MAESSEEIRMFGEDLSDYFHPDSSFNNMNKPRGIDLECIMQGKVWVGHERLFAQLCVLNRRMKVLVKSSKFISFLTADEYHNIPPASVYKSIRPNLCGSFAGGCEGLTYDFRCSKEVCNGLVVSVAYVGYGVDVLPYVYILATGYGRDEVFKRLGDVVRNFLKIRAEAFKMKKRIHRVFGMIEAFDSDWERHLDMDYTDEDAEDDEFTELIELAEVADKVPQLDVEEHESVQKKYSKFIDIIIEEANQRDLRAMAAMIASKLQTIEKNPGPATKEKQIVKDMKKLIPECRYGAECTNKTCSFFHKSGQKKLVNKEVKAVDRKLVKSVSKVVKPAEHTKVLGSAIVSRGETMGQAGKNAMKIAMAVSLPGEAPAVRWNDQYGSDPTAVASPYRRVNAVFGSNGVAAPFFSPNESVAFAFKCLQRSLVVYDSNNSAQVYNGRCFGLSETVDTQTTRGAVAPSNFWRVSCCALTVTDLIVPYISYSSAYKPHTAIQYAGTDHEKMKRFLWYDEGTMTFSVSTGPASGVMNIVMYCWTAQGLVEVTRAFNTDTSGSGTFSMPVTAGYRAFGISLADTTYTGSTVSFNLAQMAFTSSGGPVMCHLPADGFSSKIASIDAVRVYANSLMYTNDASFNSRQGKIAAYQMSSGNSWTSLIVGAGASLFDKLSTFNPGNTENVRIADNGMRVWQKMVSPKDLDMVDTTTCIDGIVFDSFYPLVSHLDYLVVVANVTNTGGQDGWFTHRMGIEFKTRDSWYDKRESTFSKEDGDNAINIMRHIPQYTTNESHLSSIWNSIKSGGKAIVDGVLEYGPKVIKVAKLLSTFI